MKNIVLIGIMGCGKTTCGNCLHKKLPDFELIDTDFEIEKKQNLQISDIFLKYGETYFRNLENDLIKNIINQNKKIVATGGGIVENIENINLFLKYDTVFYLNTPISWKLVLLSCFPIDLPCDIALSILAIILATKLKKSGGLHVKKDIK